MDMALPKNAESFELSYGIYTIERLPKGSRRTPKWDLHSIAKTRDIAETHAKTLSAQPYFDHIEIQEFKTCPKTHERKVKKIRSYSRKSSKLWFVVGGVGLSVFMLLKILA